MTAPKQESPEVAIRRLRLKQWIKEKFDGHQALLIADCATRGHELHQGELSGLLRTKSFGEKKARKLELMANMPPQYLNDKQQTYEQTNHTGNIQSPGAGYGWPFKSPNRTEWYNVLTPADRDVVEAMAATLFNARRNAPHQITPAANKSAAA